MNQVNLSAFIRQHSGQSINFGTAQNAPSPTWISQAEKEIGLSFPESYKAFLKNYGGGEIHGDEIFSIYQIPFDQVTGGDVVYQTLLNRKNGFLNEGEISICTTDYGELFFLDGNNKNSQGEYPVIRQTGKAREIFATDFVDFIVKFTGNTAT